MLEMTRKIQFEISYYISDNSVKKTDRYWLYDVIIEELFRFTQSMCYVNKQRPLISLYENIFKIPRLRAQ